MHFVKPIRSINKVFIHCSAYGHQDLFGKDLVKEISRWHKARGFKEIGYHYVIDPKGELLVGRSLEKNPAAQTGHNSKTIAICLDGLFEYQFTPQQFDTLINLANQIDEAYSNITYHGHCEVSSKSCPVFDYKRVLNLNSQGLRVKNKHSIRDHVPPPDTFITPPILKITNSGDVVRRLQTLLSIDVDGVFGQDTYRAVVEFQKRNNLVADGIVGKITWEALLERQ